MNLDIFTAPKRNSFHWTPSTISWEEIIAWLETPAKVKEAGNYVLGTFAESTVVHPSPKGHAPKPPCTDYHRTKMAIMSRGALTLDVDTPGPGFAVDAAMELNHAAIIHTTFSSTPEAPRYRVIIPLDRTIAPDEYHVAAQTIMQRLGEDNFDPGSVQPERYMFKPAEQEPGFFWSKVLPGGPAKVDDLLAGFNPDLSTIPMPRPSKSKRDPFAIEGTIGAFNRAYEDFQFLIDTYELPYESAGADRWHLAGSIAVAGMGVMAPGLVYSHHSTDPAFDQSCSAFDLVRLHLFGHLDEDLAAGIPVNKLPSNEAMLEVASQDVRVLKEILGDDFSQDLQATEQEVTQDQDYDWRLGFRVHASSGLPKDDIHNWDLITANDPAFKVLYYNELSMAIEISGDLPWRARGSRVTFDGGDRSGLALYIERTYRIRPPRAYLDDLVNDRALPRRVNPVRDYLIAQKWDGVPRLETCLPGVKPTEYTRMVARKALVAAVARMMEPGIKWDHMVVLYGLEGLGKSWWVDRMARGFSSGLGKIGDKDTLITMQRSWIMMADEGHSMRKADFDAQKEFITRTADIFRMPYDRESQVHKRHTVIWGSTNDEVFLRKQEGNRRFLILRCEDRVDFEGLTDEYIGQVWAEAMVLYRNGEKLFLTDDEMALAAEIREEFTEEEPLIGQIQEYLERPVASNWEDMTPEERRVWLTMVEDGLGPEDDSALQTVNRVCSLQIWVECLGRHRGDKKPMELREINAALKSLPGWKQLPGRHRVPGYGPQMVFVRDLL